MEKQEHSKWPLGIASKWQLEWVEYKKEWRESEREMGNIQRQIKCMPKGQECHLAICGEVKAGHKVRDGINVIQGTREPSSIWHEQLGKQKRTENTWNGTTPDNCKGNTKALIASFSFTSVKKFQFPHVIFNQ